MPGSELTPSIDNHAVAAWLEYQGELGLEGFALLPARGAAQSTTQSTLPASPLIQKPSAPPPNSVPNSVPNYMPRSMQAPMPARPPVHAAEPDAAMSDPSKAVSAPSCASAAPRGAFSLQVVRDDLGECTRCKLHTSRQSIVFGVGNPTARLMFVGEGPGGDEDRVGEPFVGKAGQLLTKMIEAMGLTRDDVYICNVVKCRPPNNRDPEPDEVAACSPFLARQLEAVRPELIVTLGKHAAHHLLNDKTPITKLRGQWRNYKGIPVMPTYHPAYLLRDPAQKRAAWDDLKSVMGKLGLALPSQRGQS